VLAYFVSRLFSVRWMQDFEKRGQIEDLGAVNIAPGGVIG